MTGGEKTYLIYFLASSLVMLFNLCLEGAARQVERFPAFRVADRIINNRWCNFILYLLAVMLFWTSMILRIEYVVSEYFMSDFDQGPFMYVFTSLVWVCLVAQGNYVRFSWRWGKAREQEVISEADSGQ